MVLPGDGEWTDNWFLVCDVIQTGLVYESQTQKHDYNIIEIIVNKRRVFYFGGKIFNRFFFYSQLVFATFRKLNYNGVQSSLKKKLILHIETLILILFNLFIYSYFVAMTFRAWFINNIKNNAFIINIFDMLIEVFCT